MRAVFFIMACLGLAAATTASKAGEKKPQNYGQHALLVQEIAIGGVSYSYPDNRGGVSGGWPVLGYRRIGRCEGNMLVNGFSTQGFNYSPATLVDWKRIDQIRAEGRMVWFGTRRNFGAFILTFKTPEAATTMATKLEVLRANCV